jgi:hypothetical protein
MNDIQEQYSPRRRLLKTSEVAIMLGVSRQWVDGLARNGVLTPVRLVPRGDMRFRVEEIESLIRGDKP